VAKRKHSRAGNTFGNPQFAKEAVSTDDNASLKLSKPSLESDLEPQTTPVSI